MKKAIFTAGLMIGALHVNAQQVAIGHNSPTNTLHVVAQNPGDEPLRIENLQPFIANDTTLLITNPANGVIRYIPLSVLSAFVGGSGSDNQNIDSLSLSGTVLTVYIENGTSANIDLNSLQDGTGTDDQNLILGAGSSSTSIIDIENGDSIIIQAGSNINLTESGNTLTISALGDGTGTDDQNIDSLRLFGTTLVAYIENGNSAFVNLAPLLSSALQNITVGSPVNTTDVSYTLTPSGNTTSSNDGDWQVNSTSNSLFPYYSSNIQLNGQYSLASGINIYEQGTGNNFIMGFDDSLTTSQYGNIMGDYNVMKYSNRSSIHGTGNIVGNGINIVDDSHIYGNGNNVFGTRMNIFGENNSIPPFSDRVNILGSYNSYSDAFSQVNIIGESNVIKTDFAQVYGNWNIAKSYLEIIMGHYATEDVTADSLAWVGTDRMFTIGNGFGVTTRSNAFVVLKNGDAFVNGTIAVTSDKEQKRNIEPLKSTLDNINQINGYSYYWKGDIRSDKKQIGFLSQEVEEVYPELILEIDGIKALNYQGLVPVLWNGVKEQQEIIEKQSIKIAELEAKLNKVLDLLENK